MIAAVPESASSKLLRRCDRIMGVLVDLAGAFDSLLTENCRD